MELAQSAKEPYNYFLLLRALFRSIGGGSHDLLYQEFLPLLPNLLQGRASHTIMRYPVKLCNASFSNVQSPLPVLRLEHATEWPSQAAHEGSIRGVVFDRAGASELLAAVLTHADGPTGVCPQWLSDSGQPGASHPGAVCGQPTA